MKYNSKLAMNVLTFWHQVEFFNSIDLKDLDQTTPGVIHYSADDLANNPFCLPWLDRNNISRAGRDYFPNKIYSYTLYFGVFKRRELFDQVKSQCESQDNLDWDERSNESGLTCSASVKVNKDGDLLLDTLEMSTAPWALGQMLKNQLDDIQFETFEQEADVFSERWQALNKLASNIKQAANASSSFTTFELIEVLKLLSEWAGFEPRELTANLIVKLHHLEQVKGQPADCTFSLSAIDLLRKLPIELAEYVTSSKDELQDIEVTSQSETSPELTPEPDVSILNSFFIRDIERARKLFKNGNLSPNSPLAQYLAPSYQRRPDLLSKEGEAIIRDQVSLAKTPYGRWPENNDHTMSLMQQFAINTIKGELVDGGLYSVNGPPGTGKTTMLRDIVADNMVKRAKVLSTLTTAKHAFKNNDLSVKIGDDVVHGVKHLIPELCGYEMVVVSSNNTAVENISKELPQSKALGPEFKSLQYLRPVAQKLAAPHDKSRQKKDTIKSLNEEDDCWGLVAAALGNSENRGRFSHRTQFKPITSLTPIGNQAAGYRTIVPAIKELIEKSANPDQDFTTAQASYRAAETAVEKTLNDLIRLNNLQSMRDSLKELKKGIDRDDCSVKQSKAFLAILICRKVSFWSFRIKKLCKQVSIIKALQLRVVMKEAVWESKRAKYKRLTSSIEDESIQCHKLATLHHDVKFTLSCDDYSSPDIQRQAFGHSKELNRVRADLTAKAFDLHQAWLIACYTKCFGVNINKFADLISGKVKDYNHAKSMWQCFFMVVPVVSSAFASVATQFSKLREGDIGWLFIDEAGQATPQQAVGALLRAKRAVVVGDPLQIEPVFTSPPEFVELLAKKILGDEYYIWSPTIASVQSVADRVNPYGTFHIREKQWLGSPLRVHRRCQDPMFSISNVIAYNGAMIHGSDNINESDDFIWGESSWFDIAGQEQGKHFVPDQAEHVLKMLYAYINEHNELPDCYMISPFRKVKSGLKDYLGANFKHPEISNNDFQNWIDGRVGTVHTFQGKEEKYVIFVLGASLPTGTGAAGWASSKPNLLNVAVTRSKKRFYIVGCKALWSGLNYFSEANTILNSPIKETH